MMKKLFSFVLIICTLITHIPVNVIASQMDLTTDPSVKEHIWDGTYDMEWEGSGTQVDPYRITNAEELAGIYKSGKDYAAKHFTITNDIYLNDISTYANWASQKPANIWTSIKNFKGSIHGNGRTIYGLYCSGSSMDNWD